MLFSEDLIELSMNDVLLEENVRRIDVFSPLSIDSEAINHLLSKSDVVHALLHDLIGFFSQPSSSLDHEERQIRLKILKNRQDLFQEEVRHVFDREKRFCHDWFSGHDSNIDYSDKFLQ